MNRRVCCASVLLAGVPICGSCLAQQAQLASSSAHVEGSTYVPLDSWVYPALLRLQTLGLLDSAFLGLRPWTRLDITRMLERTAATQEVPLRDSPELQLFLRLQAEFSNENEESSLDHPHVSFESEYARATGIAGLPLRDSFHLGQTVINDYARPYQQGFNLITGASARLVAGRASLYFRGEYQHAPAAVGYSSQLAQELASIDQVPATPQPTIPEGPIASVNAFRIMEANLSYRVLNHQISFGKSDHWLGPAQGGSLLWSNNAENIYTFQIDRTDALTIPYVSRVLGPIRYLFFVGSLKGHTIPNDPWVHVEKVSFEPTKNLEFGFSRATIWGGKGHAPITVGSFLHSFFSVQNVSIFEKQSRNDPGDRIGNFDFSYRLPYVRSWISLYCDSLVHDDVSPIDAPRRAAIRPGLYFVRMPHAPKLDLRIEASNTDPPVSRSNGGGFLYTEAVQEQGFTNKGFLLGDAVGREGKSGQAWLTYHLSPAEQIQFGFRNSKVAKDFIPSGTTQNTGQITLVKRLDQSLELRVAAQYERWRAPVYKEGRRQDGSVVAQLTWFPPHSK